MEGIYFARERSQRLNGELSNEGGEYGDEEVQFLFTNEATNLRVASPAGIANCACDLE